MTDKPVHIGLLKTAEWIHLYANQKHCNDAILVGAHARLLMDHLFLPANL